MASKYVSDTAAGKSLSAYLILDKKGEWVAKVLAHYSNGGTCMVNVFSRGADFQSAKAGGYGYDKFTAALRDMTIDGHKMSDHCGTEGIPKMPKCRKTYPGDMKAPKGYSFANYTSVSRETGRQIYGDEWNKRACESLGLPFDQALTDSQWQEMREKAFQLNKAWQASDDCESGWMSCHRKSGLDYLRDFGYQIHQVL